MAAKGNYKGVITLLLLLMFASQTSADITTDSDSVEFLRCFGGCEFPCIFFLKGKLRAFCTANCIRKCTFHRDKKPKPEGLDGCNVSYCTIDECIHHIITGSDQDSNSGSKNYAKCVTECGKKIGECDLSQLIPSPEAAPPTA